MPFPFENKTDPMSATPRLILQLLLVLVLHRDGNLVSGKNFQSRIIGGQPASSADFPYLVSVQKMVYVYVHVCGGALVKDNYVLTAAHCLSDDKMQVRAGLLRIVNVFAPKLAVQQRFVHPNYTILSNNRTTNDVALLRLFGRFNLTQTVQPIPLPEPGWTASGTAVFSGWGTVSSKIDTFSNNKMFAVLGIISTSNCRTALVNSTGFSQPLNDGNLCTQSTTSFSCYRDDGGPLVQVGKLIGIASWQVRPCDAQYAPSVFTKVSRYVNWINQTIQFSS